MGSRAPALRSKPPWSPTQLVTQDEGWGPLGRTTLKLLFAIAFGVAIVYAQYTEKTFLYTNATDGFTFQVNYIRSHFALGGRFDELEPLLWIHVIRTLVANLFEYLETLGGPWLPTLLISVLFIPIVELFDRSRRPFVAFVIPVAVMFISARSALVVVAVGYLMVYILKNKSPSYLMISFILSNLSSGAVLNNLVIAVLIANSYRRYSIPLWVYIISSFLSVIISGTDKYEGFSSGAAGYDSTVYGLTGYLAIFSRSTIFVALLSGDYVKVAAYLSLVAAAFAVLFVSLRSKLYRGYSVVFLSALPSFLLEGLGVLSLVVPLLLFAAGRPLPMRPMPAR